MIDLDRYQRLRSGLDKARRDADHAQGSLDQLMKRLVEDYDCKTLEQVEKKWKRVKEDSEVADGKYDRLLSEFEEEFGDKL